MSAFNLKKGLFKSNPFADDDEQENSKDLDEEQYEDEYESDENYEDEEYENADYEDEEAEYDDNAEYDDEEEYDDSDAEYDEDGYEDGENSYGDDNNSEYDDEYDESGEYDEEEYEEEDGYENEDGYVDEDEEDEYDSDLGYNPKVFKNLDRDSEEEYYEDNEEEEYDDEGDSSSPGWVNKAVDAVEGSEFLMYGLIILPFLAVIPAAVIWLRKKYDLKKRWIITGICAAAVIIWIIIFSLLSGGNSPKADPTSFSPNDPVETTSFATKAVTDTVSPLATDSLEPTTTPHIGAETANTGDASGYVYTTNANLYYHTIPDCDGLTNTSKVELSLATAQGKMACPKCAGGTNTFADVETETTYYCTNNGQYYHIKPDCSRMTGASAVTLANAVAAGKKACPTCIGYYGTDGGKYYHCISNCQGMQNAVTKTKEEWTKQGKTACPTCMKGTNDVVAGVKTTETQVYATQDGTYFHTKNNCSGMKGATQNSISKAIKSGKVACPKCVTKSNIKVFATKGGTYYHTKADCSGMADAEYVTAKAAISAGKKPCPKCNAGKLFGGTASATDKDADTVKLSNAKAASDDEATTVYTTKNGTYFHTEKSCSGMSGATATTVKSAVNSGKKACPKCITKAKVYVYATGTGTYFHTESDCSGMSKAQRVTAKVALEAGKKPCTKCGASKMFSAEEAKPAEKAESTVSSTMVYATDKGNYFHTKSNCSGMKDAEKLTYSAAIKAGKKACPTCVKPGNIKVYANADGKYYHTVSNCSGMSGASEVTASRALSAGKTACPTCAKALTANSTASTGAAATGNKTSTAASSSSLVYIQTGSGASDYYHVAAKCTAQSFSNGTNVTLEYALDHGYKACPSCNPPSKIYS